MPFGVPPCDGAFSISEQVAKRIGARLPALPALASPWLFAILRRVRATFEPVLVEHEILELSLRSGGG